MILNDLTKFYFFAFAIGLITLFFEKKRESLFGFIWLFSMTAYYLIFFRIQSHDYYFMIIIPVMSLIAAKGFIFSVKFLISTLNLSKAYGQQISYGLIFLSLLLFALIATKKAQPYFSLDTDTAKKIQIINKGLTDEGYVLFVYPNYDWNSVYTYYTNRRGLVKSAQDINKSLLEDLKLHGYKYAVLNGTDFNKEIFKSMQSYPLLIDEESIKVYKIL